MVRPQAAEIAPLETQVLYYTSVSAAMDMY